MNHRVQSLVKATVDAQTSYHEKLTRKTPQFTRLDDVLHSCKFANDSGKITYQDLQVLLPHSLARFALSLDVPFTFGQSMLNTLVDAFSCQGEGT